MSSLDLKLEDDSATLTEKLFQILRNFLQPDTALTIESTAHSVLALLPETAPESTEIWSFGELCIELAQQIPYHHPSQLKLAALLEHLGKWTKLGRTVTSKDTNIGQYFRYQCLKESLRDALNGPDPDEPSEWVNFHAFAANLYERRILPTNPTLAIWAQRDAHEDRREEQGSIRDAYISAAAQWILWYGQSFFKQVLYPGDVSSRDLQHWKPGPLFDGKAYLSLHRWHFWRDGFEAVASGTKEEAEMGFGQECRLVAAKAAEMMDSFERNMTF